MSSSYINIFFFFISFLGTGLLRHVAVKKNLMDIPNARSSHDFPTPRGGGLVFSLCFLGALVFFFIETNMPLRLFLTLTIPTTGVAILGFLDDCYQLPAQGRLAGHFLCAAAAIYGLGGFNFLPILHHHTLLVFLANLTGVIYLVWFLNLYNFMDGINGLATIETISISVGGLILYWLAADITYTPILFALIAVMLGFLLWNFPYARVFMGDVGSGFLGFLIGLLSLLAAQIEATLLYSWLILSAVFIVDATLTLLTRAFHGERIWEAHCTHAYQHAARALGQHWPVTISVLVINFFWLLPMAIVVQQKWIPGVYGLLIAYLPLVACVIIINKHNLTDLNQIHLSD